MLELRYPFKAVLGDWLRALCGLALGLGVLLFTPPALWRILVFGGLALLFGYFALRTLERQIQRVQMTEQGLLVSDWRRRRLPWSSLRGLRLRFYGTRRQHKRLHEGPEGDAAGAPSGGFLELRLSFGGSRLALDSALPGFALVAWRAAAAARASHVSLDPITAGNLLTLGVDPDQDTQPPELAAEWAAALQGEALSYRGHAPEA